MPLLFAYGIIRFSYDVAQMVLKLLTVDQSDQRLCYSLLKIV